MRCDGMPCDGLGWDGLPASHPGSRSYAARGARGRRPHRYPVAPTADPATARPWSHPLHSAQSATAFRFPQTSTLRSLNLPRPCPGPPRPALPVMVIGEVGRSSGSVATRSMADSTSSPPTTRPNTECLKSRCRQLCARGGGERPHGNQETVSEPSRASGRGPTAQGGRGVGRVWNGQRVWMPGRTSRRCRDADARDSQAAAARRPPCGERAAVRARKCPSLPPSPLPLCAAPIPTQRAVQCSVPDQGRTRSTVARDVREWAPMGAPTETSCHVRYRGPGRGAWPPAGNPSPPFPGGRN
jgi:hypothetical protein